MGMFASKTRPQLTATIKANRLAQFQIQLHRRTGNTGGDAPASAACRRLISRRCASSILIAANTIPNKNIAMGTTAQRGETDLPTSAEANATVVAMPPVCTASSNRLISSAIACERNSWVLGSLAIIPPYLYACALPQYHASSSMLSLQRQKSAANVGHRLRIRMMSRCHDSPFHIAGTRHSFAIDFVHTL